MLVDCHFTVTSTADEVEVESLESPRYFAVMGYLPAGYPLELALMEATPLGLSFTVTKASLPLA
jgi:hypothetical protein